MRRFRISLSHLALVIALIAVDCALVRWGLGLPNGLANGLIQPIILGSAPVVSLLGLAAILSLREWWRRGSCRTFWLGFLACGLVAVTAYAAHAYFVCPTYRHYSVDYERGINILLRRTGMAWDPRNPGGHTLRYAIVISSLVILLALPQVLFAVSGGWIAERIGRGRRRGNRTVASSELIA